MFKIYYARIGNLDKFIYLRSLKFQYIYLDFKRAYLKHLDKTKNDKK